MICEKCDPAGHIGGLERQFLERVRIERENELARLAECVNQMVARTRPPDRFTGQRLAQVLIDLDAIRNLSIVVG